MVNKKRQYSAEFKAKVALAAIREEETLKSLHAKIGELTVEKDFCVP